MKSKFYIVTANNCGYCRDFKNDHLEKLKNLMKDKPLVDRVDLIHVDLNEMSDDKPEEIKQYISWFPTFILNKNGEFLVFNGVMVDGKIKYDEGKHTNNLGLLVDNSKPPTADNIYVWVSEKSSFNNNP